MSTLQKLAVGSDVGTSRPASAGNQAPKSKRGPGQDKQAQLHPLLQSLYLSSPHTSSGSHNAANCQPIVSPSTAQHAGALSSTSGSSISSSTGSMLAAADTPSCASNQASITALAKALGQNAILHGSSAQHLLSSIAAQQQQQQFAQVQQQQQVQPANSPPLAKQQPRAKMPRIQAMQLSRSPEVSKLGIQDTSNSASGSTSSSKQSSTQPVAEEPMAWPVTPLFTKPHRPGSIKPIPICASIGANGQHSPSRIAAAGRHKLATLLCSRQSADGTLKGAHAGQPRPATAAAAASLHQATGFGHSANAAADAQPAAVLLPRPGSAVAAKIMREMTIKAGTLARPGTMQARLQQSSQISGGSSSSKDSSQPPKEQQQQQSSNAQPQPLSQQLQQQQQAQQQDAQRPRQHREQLASSGGAQSSFSRPVTAYIRALLAGVDDADGVLERLEHYRRLNNTYDSSVDLDIVHEAAAEEEHGDTVPEWLHLTANTDASQAEPMVLNLENLLGSTPEVLERELYSLGCDQLQILRDILVKHP